MGTGQHEGMALLIFGGEHPRTINLLALNQPVSFNE
jgi:hypothetical protein